MRIFALDMRVWQRGVESSCHCLRGNSLRRSIAFFRHRRGFRQKGFASRMIVEIVLLCGAFLKVQKSAAARRVARVRARPVYVWTCLCRAV